MALTKVKAGNILLTTPAASSNDVTPATTAYVTTALANLADSAPSTLDTLNELAAALGDDANFSTTVTNSIAAKAPLASPTLTGNPKINVGTDKNIIFSGGIGEIGNVAGFQAINDAGSANTDFGIRATTIRFATGSSERMRIDANGNVGIGTSSISATDWGSSSKILQIAGTQPLLSLKDTDVTDGEFQIANSGQNLYIYDAAASATRMRIHASGCIDLGANTDRSLGTNITTTVTSGSAGSGFWMSTGNSSATSSKIISSTNGSVGDLLINQGSGVNGGSIRFSINDSEKMRINSNGTVGIGTTSPSYKLQVSGTGGTRMMVENTDTNWAAVDIRSGGNQANYIFFKDDSAERARITVFDSNDISFSTGDSPSEGFRLTSGGELLIGDTTRRGTLQRGQIQVTQIDSNNAAGISCISGNNEIAGSFNLYSSGTASAMISVDPDSARASSNFYIWIDGAQKAILDSAGNFTITGSYGSSDIALKENIVTLPSQLETVKKLNPVSFDWKEKAEDGSTESSIGFVAQEVEALYPNLIRTPPEDADAEEGSTTQYKSLNYAVMVSILTKAIQEQQTIIDDLKSRIETLEG